MERNEVSPSSPARWWQWLLMYPTFGMAVLGAIPTVATLTQSYFKDVPYGEVAFVNRDDKLWEKNVRCVKETDWTGIPTVNGASVEALVCPTGDILIQLTRPDHSFKFRWIEGRSMEDKRTALLDGFVGSAYAWEPDMSRILAQARTRELCKDYLGDGRIKRIIREPDGRCIEQVINTRTGRVISSQVVPCSSGC